MLARVWVEEIDIRREPGISVMSKLRHAFNAEMQERYPNAGLYFGPETLPDGLFRPDGVFFVLHDNENPVGCVGLRKLPAQLAEHMNLDSRVASKSAEGRSLFIYPEARSGIGAALLMRALVQHAIELGYETLYGDTGPNQPESVRVLRGKLRGWEQLESEEIPLYDPNDPLANFAARFDLRPLLVPRR